MTHFSRLKLEMKPSAARLTLARPEVRNAFDDVLIAELTRALEELRASYEAAPERSPRALVLAGEGAVFCAGADMNWMRRSVAYTQSENEADARRMAAMYRTLDELPIACCDMAVAVDTAQFGFTEARLGIAPAVISPFVLPKIGGSAARRYFLTAEIFGAVQAKEIGLVHEIVPAGELDPAVDRLVAALAENGPRAVSAAKRLIREALARNRDDALENAIRAIAGLRASPEGQEGLGAFLEKRPPSWKL